MRMDILFVLFFSFTVGRGSRAAAKSRNYSAPSTPLDSTDEEVWTIHIHFQVIQSISGNSCYWPCIGNQSSNADLHILYHRIRVIKCISSMDSMVMNNILQNTSQLNEKYLCSIFGNAQGLHRKEMLMARLNMMELIQMWTITFLQIMIGKKINHTACLRER